MSQSASALHEQLSSHFFKSSHNLKFLNCFSSFFTLLKSLKLVSAVSELFVNVALPPFGNCYPFCHMNTSCSSVFLFRREAISSSNVTIFSFCLGPNLRGAFTVRGRKLLPTGPSPVIDRSNSLILRGTKYSIKGSAPENR